VIQRDELIRWWASIEPGLVRFARSYGRDLESSRDAVQDIAVLVLKQYSKAVSDPWKDYVQFSGEEEFRRWVYARLHWILLDRFRSTKPLLEPLDEFASEASVPPDQEQVLIVGDILKLIGDFPKNQKIALCRLIEGRSGKEIAQELHVQEATVRSLQRHARMRLATLLAEQEIRK
jgi:RNA polymerase sigma factor (sigma-70 family)